MAKIHQGFKVVYAGSLFDFCDPDKPSIKTFRSFCCLMNATVSYTPYKWTSPLPSCGPLAVFDNLDNAMAWVTRCLYLPSIAHYKLFTCEYRRSIAKSLWTTHQGTKFLEVKSIHLPYGTQCASAIKLLEEIPMHALSEGNNSNG